EQLGPAAPATGDDQRIAGRVTRDTRRTTAPATVEQGIETVDASGASAAVASGGQAAGASDLDVERLARDDRHVGGDGRSLAPGAEHRGPGERPALGSGHGDVDRSHPDR